MGRGVWMGGIAAGLGCAPVQCLSGGAGVVACAVGVSAAGPGWPVGGCVWHHCSGVVAPVDQDHSPLFSLFPSPTPIPSLSAIPMRWCCARRASAESREREREREADGPPAPGSPVPAHFGPYPPRRWRPLCWPLTTGLVPGGRVASGSSCFPSHLYHSHSQVARKLHTNPALTPTLVHRVLCPHFSCAAAHLCALASPRPS